MINHLQYASYVVRHKAFVFRAGLRVGAPVWRLIVHDWSKLLPGEWLPYARVFYGGTGKPTPEAKAKFDVAWLKHIHKQPHHWQHWLLQRDEGDVRAIPMPLPLAREMVADWYGASRAITGEWKALAWYMERRDRIILHPETRAYVEYLLHVSGWN